MDGRWILALSVTVLLVAPGAAAVHGSEDHRAGCGDGVHQDVEGYAAVDVDPGDDCGVSYDSDSNTLRVTPTFDQLRVAVWDYPYATHDLTPNQVTPADGVQHPVGEFLKAVDGVLEELGVGPNDEGLDVDATDDGLVIQARDQQVEVPWPRNPRTERQIIDDENLYVPTSYRTSSDERIDDAVALIQATCSTAEATSTCSSVDAPSTPMIVPTIVAGYRISNVSASGIPTSLAGGLAAATDAADAATSAPATGARASTGSGPEAPLTGSKANVAAQQPGSSIQLPGGGASIAAAAATVLAALGIAVLYRRLTSEDVLDHPLRSEVFEYIKEHPGVTTQELSEALDVDYSTASHHVSVLGDFDLVHAQSAGRVTHYFENHGTFDALEKEAIPLLREGTSAKIARIVGDRPRITPSAIARELEVDPSTVKWHADKLRAAGVLESEPLDGRSIGFVVAEKARDVVEQWT